MSVGLDPNLLLSFYQAKLASTAATASAQSATTQTSTTRSSTSATANDSPPWETPLPAQQIEDAKVLSTTDFLDTTNVPLSAGSSTDSKTEQDNQKLFSLYSGVNTLAYLAKIAQRSTTTAGQLAGLNTRFQAGLAQVQSYISSTTFNNFSLQAATPSASVTSNVVVPFGSFDYATKTLVSNANLGNALPGLSPSDSFTIAVKKGGTTTNVGIDLAQIQGPLTLDNVVSYVNQTLSSDGFATRFQKVLTAGTVLDPTKATYGLQVSPGGSETVSLSSASATPSLYLAGSSGVAAASSTTTTTAGTTTTTAQAADQQGRLIKLSDIASAAPTSTLSVSAAPTSGTTTAQSTVVDGSGNVYVLGNATGNFGNQVNQGSQDAYLTKYDSAGNVLWTRLLGSTGTANGAALALDPTGGVVIAGSTTAALTTTSVTDGNTDTFVAKYDAQGNQTWVKQLQTLSTNQAASVSVDGSGNVYLGGQVSGGVVGSGQTTAGGADAYVAKLDKTGKVVYEKQFGTSASDTVSATATAADGSLYVASVQNGHAIVSKYANGDATAAPVWSSDLGDLQNGGGIGGLAVSGNQIYISATTQNPAINPSGASDTAVAASNGVSGAAASGGSDAVVVNLVDQGSSVSTGFVSYVGTAGQDKAGAITVGGDGTVYLTGSTTGTFAGQTRNIAGVSNSFATALSTKGAVEWTKQYGGLDGISSGTGIAVDASGSSVLDALGLPKGTINPNQTVDLTAQTTLRAGDSFQIQFQGVAPRTATISIDPGETLQSLATKINIQLQTYGKASVTYTGGAEGLTIAVNPGTTLTLASGPADFDALSRLGIAPGTLASASTATATASTTSSSGTTTPAYGLGLGDSFDLTTTTGADLARSQLLGVLSKIQTAYQKTNAPATAATTPGNTTGTASPYLTSQISSYNLALSLFNGGSSSTSTTA